MEPGFESMSSQKTSAAHVIKLEKKPTLSTIPQISNDASTPPLLYDLYTHPESSVTFLFLFVVVFLIKICMIVC
jgi:hypothetical protein